MAALGISVRMKGTHTSAVISLLVIVVSMIDYINAGGPLCYSCLHVAHQRDCTRIVQCGSHQRCFGRRFLTPDGLIYFSSGCESIAGCGARRSYNLDHTNTLLQKASLRAGNGDIQACDQCCQGDYCNLQLCDIPIQLKQRCLFCDDVINPEDCNLSLQCDEDQYCYTEHIYVNDEKRFRMGCAQKSGCIVAQEPVVGRRDSHGYRKAPPTESHGKAPSIERYRKALPTDRTYCAKCCTGPNCNRDLCTSRTVINQYELSSPPPLVLCQDYDESACRNGLTNPSFCQDQVNRQLHCPRTCNTCNGPPIPPPATTITTTPGVAVTTPATVGPCVDGANCQQYASFFCNPSNPGGLDVCPITCKKPECTGGTTACEDPIPSCQCEYLQNNLDICSDGDPELQKFCCFYCKKFHDPSWVCSAQDKTICNAYEKPFSTEIAGLNITCHTN
ncbi:uncharacterized protein LOC125663470 isoform X2 [Ostrea edulis]|uniref:uncharacterized protein LOC125663470 isoform X2 n=1 Tax=Ostrea edulis TaxID=37623 RepID=UPI0020957D5E|nr:uncharacterized protein LOC125663470 isoform X2 [Ostrea edulis]